MAKKTIQRMMAVLLLPVLVAAAFLVPGAIAPGVAFASPSIIVESEAVSIAREATGNTSAVRRIEVEIEHGVRMIKITFANGERVQVDASSGSVIAGPHDSPLPTGTSPTTVTVTARPSRTPDGTRTPRPTASATPDDHGDDHDATRTPGPTASATPDDHGDDRDDDHDATRTPGPTASATPDDHHDDDVTGTPSATGTPAATRTAEPSHTPEPTSTPRPTTTVSPTGTAQPTPSATVDDHGGQGGHGSDDRTPSPTSTRTR